MSMPEHLGQFRPADPRKEVEQGHQVTPEPPAAQQPPVIQDASQEVPAPPPADEAEMKAPVDESDLVGKSAPSPNGGPASPGPTPVTTTETSEPIPVSIDQGDVELLEKAGYEGAPQAVYNSSFRDVDKVVMAGRIDKLHVDHRGEPLRITEISVDDLAGEARERFTPPKGIEAIEEDLFVGERRVVLLTIEEGGRDLTARYLVSADSERKPRRIHPPVNLTFESWQLNEYRKSAFLLDLADVEIEKPKRVLQNLLGLRGALAEQGSFLIVLVGDDHLDETQREELGVSELKRPDPYAVLYSRLDAAITTAGTSSDTRFTGSEAAEHGDGAGTGSDAAFAGSPEQWVAFARARRLLHGKPPVEALRLCKAIVEATEHWNSLAPTEQESLKEQFNERYRFVQVNEVRLYVERLALDRFQAWETELDAWNRKYQDQPRLRAFQLAIAVVPSGDPIQIRSQATALLQRIGRQQLEAEGIDDAGASIQAAREPALSGLGTRLLAHESLAELQDGKVVFTKPGFDEAVVRYFWNDWPEYRDVLLDWLMKLATDDNFKPDVRAKLKERIGDFAIHHAQERGELSFLYDVVSKWADEPATLGDAARLLEEAATKSGIAGSVRKRTREWTTQQSQNLKRAVAELCARPTFAREFPGLVATRLGHLLESQEDGEKDPVLDSALQRASQLLVTAADQSHFVLTKLSTDAKAEAPEKRKRAAGLFLPIAQARMEGAAAPALIAQAKKTTPGRGALVTVWGTALRLLDEPAIQPAFNAWMDACTVPETASQVIRVFGDAIATEWDGSGAANHALARLSGVWKATTDLPPEHANDLDRRLLTAARDAMTEVEHRAFNDRGQGRE